MFISCSFKKRVIQGMGPQLKSHSRAKLVNPACALSQELFARMFPFCCCRCSLNVERLSVQNQGPFSVQSRLFGNPVSLNFELSAKMAHLILNFQGLVAAAAKSASHSLMTNPRLSPGEDLTTKIRVWLDQTLSEI